MGIRGIPGVTPDDFQTAYPVRHGFSPGDDPDTDTPHAIEGAAFSVLVEPITSAQQYVQGRQSQQVSFNVYADWRRGTPYPVTRNDRLWLAEGSETRPDGTRDLDTALDIDSVTPSPYDGAVVIQCGRAE